MTPNDYFIAFVVGNFEEYQQSPGDVRLAFNAAVPASHLADHYFMFNHKYSPAKIPFDKIGEFVEYINTRTNGCFRDIRSISNAYKHLYENPGHANYSSISSTGAIESISFTYSEVITIEEEWSRNTNDNHIVSQVIFTRKNGKKVNFLPTLKTVIDFWQDYLSESI